MAKKVNYNTDYTKELRKGQKPKFVKNRLCPKCDSKLVILPPDRVWCEKTKCIYGELHIIGEGTYLLETE